MQNTNRGGTQWRKLAMLLVPPMAGILVMAALTFTGVTPLNLAITGQDFKVASRSGSYVTATQGATAYADLVEMSNGSIKPALKAGVRDAEMSDGVCLSLVLTFPVIGSFTVQLQTTGYTRLTDVTAHVGLVAARGADINPETDDGKAPALDTSNVSRSILANKDASEVDLEGGHPGALGLEIPGAVRAGSLQIGGLGATIAGTLEISGIALPRVAHGRGVGHGECF